MGWLLVVNNIKLLILLLLCHSMASDSHHIAWFTSSESNPYDPCKSSWAQSHSQKTPWKVREKLDTLHHVWHYCPNMCAAEGKPNPFSRRLERGEDTMAYKLLGQDKQTLAMWDTLTRPLTCDNFWPNMCSTDGKKRPIIARNSLWYHV
jgi:hypothetical protein